MTLEEVLRKYIDGTYHTLKEASESNGYTIDQIKYFIRTIKNSTDIAKLKLYESYILTADLRKKEAVIKGGQTGKRTINHTLEDVKLWYDLIVNNDMTIVDVEKKTGVPRTVIYENLDKYLSSEEKEKLRETYIKHRALATKKIYKNDIEFFPDYIDGDVVVVTTRSRRGRR